MTDHQIVGDYPILQAVLAPLHSAGLRLAIDDAGSGFASMRHALLLEPDLLKLDMSLVRGIDTDAAKRSLCQAVTGFAARPGPAHALYPAPVDQVSVPARPDQAVQIRAVVNSLRRHASPATSAAALNAQGLLARSGRRWHPTSVSRQLLA